MSNYSDLLKDPRWQKKRLEIFKRDHFTCKKCEDTESTLHVHHLKYTYGKKPWEYNKKDLLTVCKDCHGIMTRLSKDYEDFDSKKCKIYKSTGWTSGSILLFCSHTGLCRLDIINEYGKFITEYDISSWEIPSIIKILKAAHNGQSTT